MSITQKIKWQRALGQLRFEHEELGFIKQISKEYAQDFQAYYEAYCAKRGVDISKLNDQHRDRVGVLYNIEKTIPNKHDEPEPDIDPADDMEIALHKGTSQEDEKNQQEYQMTADEAAIHAVFSKLFKRIALKIHPDKLQDNIPIKERELNLIMFQKANKSFEERKYYVLLDIAAQLKISTPKNYSQQTRWMKKESIKLDQEIKQQKSTYNFIFSELECDEERDQVIRSFIQQVFQVDTQ